MISESAAQTANRSAIWCRYEPRQRLTACTGSRQCYWLDCGMARCLLLKCLGGHDRCGCTLLVQVFVLECPLYADTKWLRLVDGGHSSITH